MNLRHTPVMVSETVKFFEAFTEGIIIDGTLGAGGHSLRIFESGFRGRIVGIDRDSDAIRLARETLRSYADRLEVREGCFAEVLGEEEFPEGEVCGLLLDLGISSMQVDDPGRGFSYRRDGPLDMRMGKEGITAADFVNTAEEETLADVFREYGQERFAGGIARRIVEERREEPILTTSRLSEIVLKSYGPRGRRLRRHPSARVFQALRIYLNGELTQLERGLEAGSRILGAGGVFVVISYHSLEDRIVKRYFRDRGDEMEILTRKPLRPSRREILRNPRARSARLRAAKKAGVGT